MNTLNTSNAGNFRYCHKLSRTVTDYIETKLARATATVTRTESFRFYDEDDRNNDSFSVLSSAYAGNSVIWAGKRDSRRHFTTGFCENVVVTETSY